MKLGKRQQAALDFILRCNGWHSFANDVKREILSLAKLGLVEVNEFNQFRKVSA